MSADQWYPLRETGGTPSTYCSTNLTRSNCTEDKNIDELWSKFVSTYSPTTKLDTASTWCHDVHVCGSDYERLHVEKLLAADLKCTCDHSSGNSHGCPRSREAPDPSPLAPMSLQEACKVFKRGFIYSSKKRQDGIKCHKNKGTVNEMCNF